MQKSPESPSRPIVAMSKHVGSAGVRSEPDRGGDCGDSSASSSWGSPVKPPTALPALAPTARLALLIAALILVACSSGERATKGTAAPSLATAPSTTVLTPEASVLDAYRRYWQVFVAVGSEMNLPDPRLREVATGEALAQAENSFLAGKLSGEVVRGSIDLAPEVAFIEGDEAVIEDCYASHILGYDAATGQPKGRERPERTEVTVGMRREGGTWKVAGIRHEGYGCTPAS